MNSKQKVQEYRYLNINAGKKRKVSIPSDFTEFPYPQKIRGKGIKCAVQGCMNTQYNTDGTKSGYRFFTVPGDEETEEKWRQFLVRASGREDFRITSGVRVCSAHFDQEELEACYNARTDRYKMTKANVPTILNIQPSSKVTPYRLINLPPILVCETCDEQFTSYGDYYLHVEVHTGIRGMSCPPYATVECFACKICLPGAMAAIKHMSCHTIQKPFQCSTCTSDFDSVTERNRCVTSHSKKGKRKK